MSDTPRTDAIFNGIKARRNARGFHMPEDLDDAEKSHSQLELDLAAANRSLDWCGQQIDGCGKYTKDGETISQALERNWIDSQNALGLFAKERIRAEKAEQEAASARHAYDKLVQRHDQEIERAKSIAAAKEAVNVAMQNHAEAENRAARCVAVPPDELVAIARTLVVDNDPIGQNEVFMLAREILRIYERPDK